MRARWRRREKIMATMNRVQCQAGMSVTQFMERYGTQAQCEAALEKIRWRERDHFPLE